MREQPRYLAGELTRFKPLAPKYYGYTAMDWFKFYGFFAGMILMLAFVYIKYLGLFEDIETQAPEYKLFALGFSTVALLVVLPAALGFLYWAAGALVRYSLWQQQSPRFWRGFWFVVLLFYFFFEFDPLDKIHPAMSRQGLLYVPKLIMLIFDRKLEFTLFQMGYFLLWMLFWFLVVMLHMSYILRGLAVIWFYTKRFNRYGASILTGFRETLAVAQTAPVTVQWPAQRTPLPQRFRGRVVQELAGKPLQLPPQRGDHRRGHPVRRIPLEDGGELSVELLDLLSRQPLDTTCMVRHGSPKSRETGAGRTAPDARFAAPDCQGDTQRCDRSADRCPNEKRPPRTGRGGRRKLVEGGEATSSPSC